MTRAPAQGFSAAGFGSPSSAPPASAAPAGIPFGVAAAAPASASPFGRPQASPAATSSGPSTAAAAACAGSLHEKIDVTQDALRCVDATISTVAVSCAPRLAADFSCSNCAPQDVYPALASSLQRTRAALQVELCIMTLLRLLDEHRALSPQFRVKLSIARDRNTNPPHTLFSFPLRSLRLALQESLSQSIAMLRQQLERPPAAASTAVAAPAAPFAAAGAPSSLFPPPAAVFG